MWVKIQDPRRERARGETWDQRKGGTHGTEDINSSILRYRNRQFSNIGNMRDENWF